MKTYLVEYQTNYGTGALVVNADDENEALKAGIAALEAKAAPAAAAKRSPKAKPGA